MRENDPATFDHLLGGQTQDPSLRQAFIIDANGRFQFRGFKPIEDFTALERESAQLPLSEKQQRELARRAEKLRVVHV